MAKKKVSKARTGVVPSLKPHLTRSLKEAKALRRKVADAGDLEALISNLEAMQLTASSNCGTSTWGRKFALAAKPATKTSRKSAKKR